MAIFVNYRRKDSASVTRLIHERLCAEFGKEFIYLDVDSIPLGTDFVQHLSREVSKCDVMLVIIGNRWLSSRLDDENDFVRLEIEAALDRRIPAIPVLVEDATLPDSKKLPPSLRRLVRMQATRIDSDSRFDGEMESLIKGINKLLKMPVRKSVMPSAPQRWMANARRIRFKTKLSTVLLASVFLIATVFVMRTLMPSQNVTRAEEGIDVEKNTLPNTNPDTAETQDASEINDVVVKESAPAEPVEPAPPTPSTGISETSAIDDTTAVQVEAQEISHRYIVDSNVKLLNGKYVSLASERQPQADTQTLLKTVSEQMNVHKTWTLHLAVHTGYLPTTEENAAEAQQVAETLKRVFVDDFKIGAKRITVEGTSDSPSVSSTTSIETQQNAGRIELKLQKTYRRAKPKPAPKDPDANSTSPRGRRKPDYI